MIKEGVRTCLFSGSKLSYELRSLIGVLLLDPPLYLFLTIPLQVLLWDLHIANLRNLPTISIHSIKTNVRIKLQQGKHEFRDALTNRRYLARTRSSYYLHGSAFL